MKNALLVRRMIRLCAVFATAGMIGMLTGTCGYIWIMECSDKSMVWMKTADVLQELDVVSFCLTMGSVLWMAFVFLIIDVNSTLIKHK